MLLELSKNYLYSLKDRDDRRGVAEKGVRGNCRVIGKRTDAEIGKAFKENADEEICRDNKKESGQGTGKKII